MRTLVKIKLTNKRACWIKVHPASDLGVTNGRCAIPYNTRISWAW